LFIIVFLSQAIDEAETSKRTISCLSPRVLLPMRLKNVVYAYPSRTGMAASAE
jgi:hypothetical protein